MFYLHLNNFIKVPRGRAPRSRSSGIVVGCPGDVPGSFAEGSGITARRERTTACRAHRDLRGGGILRREEEASGARLAGRSRPGGIHEPDVLG